MSGLLLYQAAEVAGFDAKSGWPPELEFRQLEALLLADAPGPWGRMLVDAVVDGKLECRKTGELRYWLRAATYHSFLERKTRALTNEEIALLEAARARGEQIGLESLPLRVFHHDERIGIEHETGEKNAPVGCYYDEFGREHRVTPGKIDTAAIRWHFSREKTASWLQSIGAAAGPLVGAWLGEAVKLGADGTAKAGERKPTRTEIRIAAILEVASELKYPPKAIPWGGKAAIKRECLEKKAKAPYFFTLDTFATAWKAAKRLGLIEVSDADTYRGQHAAKPHGS